MATFINVDNEYDAFRVMSPSVGDSSALEYVKKGIQAFQNAVDPAYRYMANDLTNRYETIMNSDVLRKVAVIRHKLGNVFKEDTIRPLTKILEVQTAMPVMQKYVMAMPVIREAYKAGLCHGYGEDYIDEYPTQGVGKEHYTWRRVMDGVITVDERGAKYTNYFEPITNNDDILNIIQKASVLNTWSVIQAEMDAGNRIDPTSTWNQTW